MCTVLLPSVIIPTAVNSYINNNNNNNNNNIKIIKVWNNIGNAYVTKQIVRIHHKLCHTYFTVIQNILIILAFSYINLKSHYVIRNVQVRSQKSQCIIVCTFTRVLFVKFAVITHRRLNIIKPKGVTVELVPLDKRWC